MAAPDPASKAGPNAGARGPGDAVVVLDTAALLAGLGPAQGAAAGGPGGPPAGGGTRWVCPPEVRAEIAPGGPTGRALERAVAGGLEVVGPSSEALTRVEQAAHDAGETDRLSAADRAVLALALDQSRSPGTRVVIWSDDYAVLNLAARLELAAEPVTTEGIRSEASWYVRCTGCGRYPEGVSKDADCPVCGSPLKRTRRPPGRR